MSNFKGTKGPWKIDIDPESPTVKIQSDDPEARDVCTVWAEPTFTKSVPNALLISKAPEMLEMLEMHLDSLDLSDFEFYQKYGFNAAEVFPRTRKLIKEATTV